jgi:hypothetical protein
VLRRIFALRGHEMTVSLRKLPDEELHKLYSTPRLIRMDKSRWMRLIWYVARMEKRNACNTRVGKEGRRAPGRPRRRWDDDIAMDLRDMRCDWSGS